MNDIEIKKTLSLCPVCYKEIIAAIVTKNGQVWMEKECNIHGKTRTLVEIDELFYKMSGNGITGSKFNRNVCSINSTDKCNLDCVNCYHQPNNNKLDICKNLLIEKCKATGFSNLILMGAEPTMREDLPELIADIKRLNLKVGIYTNGIKLADSFYLQELIQAGIESIALSLHPKNHSEPKIYEKKMVAIENLKKIDKKLDHVSFVISDLNELGEVLNKIKSLKNIIHPLTGHFRIKTIGQVGKACNSHKEIFLSDLCKETFKHGNAIVSDDADNNLYHININFEGINVRLIHWQGVSNIDLNELNAPPYANFVGSFISNFLHQIVIQEGMQKGWFAGKNLVQET